MCLIWKFLVAYNLFERIFAGIRERNSGQMLWLMYGTTLQMRGAKSILQATGSLEY